MTRRDAVLAFACVAAATGAAIACARWPLSVYATTLLLFGVPHALVELQWVARRYGGSRSLAMRVGLVLGAIALARLVALAVGCAPTTSATIELALGAVLVACVLRVDGGHGGPLRPGAAAAGIALLTVAATRAPIDAMLVLAIVHNLTPAGFVADRLRDGDASRAVRTKFALAGIGAFVVLPLWLASGAAASGLGLASIESTNGDHAVAAHLGLVLRDGIGAFAPSFVPAGRTLDLLRAAAFLQVVHYVGVLLVLPRLRPAPLDDPRARPLPARSAFFVLVAGLGLVFATAFVVDFREARATYGVLAAVHVWLEFPALLLALAPRVPSPRLA